MTLPTPLRFRKTQIALAIFGVAFGVRLLHLRGISSAPFFTLLLGDARSYDAWARRIAGGDWIGGEAREGREAVELARRLQPDIVLMDLSMPGLDGLAATRLISAELP